MDYLNLHTLYTIYTIYTIYTRFTRFTGSKAVQAQIQRCTICGSTEHKSWNKRVHPAGTTRANYTGPTFWPEAQTNGAAHASMTHSATMGASAGTAPATEATAVPATLPVVAANLVRGSVVNLGHGMQGAAEVHHFVPDPNLESQYSQAIYDVVNVCVRESSNLCGCRRCTRSAIANPDTTSSNLESRLGQLGLSFQRVPVSGDCLFDASFAAIGCLRKRLPEWSQCLPKALRCMRRAADMRSACVEWISQNYDTVDIPLLSKETVGTMRYAVMAEESLGVGFVSEPSKMWNDLIEWETLMVQQGAFAMKSIIYAVCIMYGVDICVWKGDAKECEFYSNDSNGTFEIDQHPRIHLSKTGNHYDWLAWNDKKPKLVLPPVGKLVVGAKQNARLRPASGFGENPSNKSRKTSSDKKLGRPKKAGGVNKKH